MSDMSGGVQARASRPFLHAYISCAMLGDQEFGHSCAHGLGPHEIKVCIVESDNKPELYTRLRGEASP